MDLLERFARGDMDAFEALFREFQREVFGWIVRIVRDVPAAEDLTVEAFWRMYRAHARFDPRHRAPSQQSSASAATNQSAGSSGRLHPESDPGGSFGAWARRIATNVALDHLKKLRRELPLASDPADEVRTNPAIQREMREQIDTAFRHLSPKLRAVVTLALVEDVPYEEIAQALGISVVTVRVRVFRAVRILRRQLSELIAVVHPSAREPVRHTPAEAQRK